MAETATDRIQITPGVRGGKPRIANTRITVADIVIWTEQGQSTDEIVTGYPQLTLADVHTALAYYYSNQAAIDQQIHDSEMFAEDLRLQCEESKNRHRATSDGDSVPS